MLNTPVVLYPVKKQNIEQKKLFYGIARGGFYCMIIPDIKIQNRLRERCYAAQQKTGIQRRN